MVAADFPLDETAATLALQRARVVPQEHLGALIGHTGSALRLVELAEEDRLFAWPKPVHQFIGAVTAEDLQRAREDLAVWRAQGLEPVTVLDSGYPEPLHDVFNRPPLLFIRGVLPAALGTRSVSIVGARAAGPKALGIAAEITSQLVSDGFVILSGLAVGIDTAAHRATLQAGGVTCAVLGSGLKRLYPAENATLAEEILASGGTLISQFTPDQPPTKWTFPMRNVVMSGLSLATIVVEASDTSGARIQARVALQHGRTVFLHSELVRTREWARKYVTEGAFGTRAVEITSAADVIERLDVALRGPITVGV